MSNELEQKRPPNQTVIYQIRVRGHLAHEWRDGFDGLTISLDENGDTL
jgi:hypothetical protein